MIQNTDPTTAAPYGEMFADGVERGDTRLLAMIYVGRLEALVEIMVTQVGGALRYGNPAAAQDFLSENEARSNAIRAEYRAALDAVECKRPSRRTAVAL